jgi:hypothetical protein
MKNVQKRYIFLGIVIVVVGILIWRLSTSYASMNQGYSGKNIISGDKWGINITNVSDIEKVGNAEISKEVSTIGTTLNFSAVLFKPGDKISFNIEVENTSSLSGELYALTLTGLNDIDGENITYTILPVDGSIIHSNDTEGSILKSGGKQTFNITLVYDEISTSSNEYHLNLGSTIIYKQK